MNKQKYLIATIAAFVFVFVFEMLWHGYLMKGMYDATASVWRSHENSNMNVMFLSQFLFAAVFALIYTHVGKHLACKKGIQFGFFVGLLMATADLGAYCYLPIPFKIVALWIVSTLIKCVGAGFVVAAIYKEQ